MGLSIASVAYGSLLGVFLLGVLTRRTSEGAAMVGMSIGFALNIGLWLFTPVAFTWYVVFGSVTTFVTGYLLSWWLPQAGAAAVSLNPGEPHATKSLDDA
jgi:Na+/proline symporter